jgi:hypothetical protein
MSGEQNHPTIMWLPVVDGLNTWCRHARAGVSIVFRFSLFSPLFFS